MKERGKGIKKRGFAPLFPLLPSLGKGREPADMLPNNPL